MYCHGSTALLGNHTSPAWTSTAGITCDACHGLPPADTRHTLHFSSGVQCDMCHPGYSVDTLTVNLATHLDGTNEASPVTTTATFTSWPSDCTACHPGGAPR